MIESGFNKFQEQCKYCQYTIGTDIEAVDCSCITTHYIPVCTHENNRFEQDGEKYVLRCRLFRCPFYSEKDRNYDWGIFVNGFISYTTWLNEHSQETESTMYQIYENWVHQNKDSKIKLTNEECEEFYSKNWNFIKPISNKE